MKYTFKIDRFNEEPYPNSFVWRIIISQNQYLTNNWTYMYRNSAKQALYRMAKRFNIELEKEKG